MYSKLHGFTHLFIALALGAAGVAAAQAPAPAPAVATPSSATAATAAPGATATLRGHVADPTDAMIPGATITITTAAGVTVATTTADASGAYQVSGLAPGKYIVLASIAGFAPFASQPIQLAAGQVMHVKISMAMAVEQQSVTVTDESPTVNVEAGGNASAIVLKGKDLDALSDDPDELSNELTALAGPSAGPNGGQIYIDGFSGGQLPPKSAIREIRINQNPFSAEFDQHRLRPHRDSHQAGNRQAARPVLHPGQRQSLQYRQSLFHSEWIGDSSLLQLSVQRHGERRALQDGFLLCQRRAAQHREHQCLGDSGRCAGKQFRRIFMEDTT